MDMKQQRKEMKLNSSGKMKYLLCYGMAMGFVLSLPFSGSSFDSYDSEVLLHSSTPTQKDNAQGKIGLRSNGVALGTKILLN
ncbi:hypothetical protein SESBI_30309 [Sesbania bispinosa]|nr:hypothetical protein SESBI_30309 [Sesbania bispinosa]